MHVAGPVARVLGADQHQTSQLVPDGAAFSFGFVQLVGNPDAIRPANDHVRLVRHSEARGPKST